MLFLCSLIFAAIPLFTACNSNKAVLPHAKTLLKAAGTTGTGDVAQKPAANLTGRRKKAATMVSIKAPEFEANLYWTIPFTPRGAGEGLIEADSGSQFILLDLSFQNTTADKFIDMGEVLLTARVRDEEGREYTSDPLIIAAFNLEYPFPGHQEQYRSLKGVLSPGAIHRTVVFGFEAPACTKNFTLFLDAGSNSAANMIYKAPFTLKEHLISDQVFLQN